MVSADLFNRMVDFIRQQPWELADPLMQEIKQAVAAENHKQQMMLAERRKMEEAPVKTPTEAKTKVK